MMLICGRFWGFTKILRDRRGVAAIEFAIVAGFISVGALNTADVVMYARDRMEVENATEMGAQAAWKTCDMSHLPATVNCPGLNAAITAAIQSTSLGAKVSLQMGSPAEAYYCVNASGVLTYVANTANKPADCSAVGQPSSNPGDYIQVQTTFAFAPVFPGITIAGTFPATITKTAWMRLG